MKSLAHKCFQGFSHRSIAFLRALKAHNDKLWFDAHWHEYNAQLLAPMQNLVSDLGEIMLGIDPLFEVRPAVNKTISRIYRDTRFSRDKSPFRTAMWFTFKRPGEGWQDAPAYFFELTPNAYRYGMGFYHASRDTMDKLREIIDANPKVFLKAISFYSKQKDFVVEGEMYKRILKPGLPADLHAWYQRKSFYLVCNRKNDQTLFSGTLIRDIKSGYKRLAPLYYFMRNVASKTNGK
ncbi:MAG: DUF2461 domain-containing protein [Nitrospirota bacterium]